MTDSTDCVTCGPLFQECLTHFITKLSGDPLLLFAAGMATGQAEKIYLGACSAAMFRPSPENRAKMIAVAVYLSGKYGLEVSLFERTEIRDEIWLHTKESTHVLSQCLQEEEYNSPGWHYFRGLICGVPLDRIDPEFHLRKGFGEPCDK